MNSSRLSEHQREQAVLTISGDEALARAKSFCMIDLQRLSEVIWAAMEIME